MTIEQAADRLKVTVACVRQWIRQGAPRAYATTAGGKRHLDLDPDALLAWRRSRGCAPRHLAERTDQK